ncbi:MAG: DUF2341 domain-containing protein [Fibrobacteria bacterium]
MREKPFFPFAFPGMILALTVMTAQAATFYWNRNGIISNTDFNQAYNWTSNANNTGTRPLSVNDDDFTSDTKDAAWTFRDADNDGSTGSYSLTTNSDQLTLVGRGQDTYLTSNQYVAFYRNDITGDFDVAVKVTSQTNTSGWAKTGIMMADDFTNLGSGGYAQVAVSPSNGFAFQYDLTTTVGELDAFANTGTAAYPCWLRLIKNGTSVTAYYKTSVGNSWSQIGTAQTPQSTSSNSQIGLFSTSQNTGSTCTAVFDDFQAGTAISATTNDLSFNGSGGNADVNATMSASLAASSIDFTGYTGTFNFGSYTLTINSGNANLSGMTGLTPGTGTLAFTGSSGTQVFTPKSSGSHPNITHTGAGTLQLSTNALSCLSYTQSAGTLDLNSVNLTTTSSGNFTVTNGSSASVTNMGGRTITVAGAASFTGQASDLINLDPGSAWTIAVTGALTASYARVGYSTASVSTGLSTDGTNEGGNSGWNFQAPNFSAWSYSTQININTTATGANIASNLTTVPLLVRLDSNNFSFSQAALSGADIRFADPDGSQLAYEVARWDNTRRKAEIWVNVPQIDGNSDRDYITMYWGNISAVSLSRGANAFASADWKAWYHLEEDPSSAATPFVDASGNGNVGSDQGPMAATDTLSAVSGLGTTLSSTSKYISTATQYSNPTIFTTGVWFKTTTTVGGGLQAFSANQTGGGGSRDRVVWMDNTGKLSCGAYTGVTKVATSTAAYNDGQWHFAVMRLSGSGQFLYVDGAQVATDVNTSAQNFSGYWRFGNFDFTSWSPTPTNSTLQGSLDEGFVNHSELSADWIKFMYYNQRPNSAILTLANTTLSTWTYSRKVYVNTTPTGANVSGNVTDFPMLVRLTQGNFDFTQARSDGGDLRFADSSGNLLNYEIERYDATNKRADIWVQIPTVYGNNNSQWFRMYWGKSSATSLSSGAYTYPTSGNYVGVYHLKESSGTTADATANDQAGSFNGSVPNQVTGNIGKAHSFDGNGDYINVATDPLWNMSSGDKVTVSAWVNRTGANVSAATEEGIAGRFEWTSGNYREFCLINNTSDGFRLTISSDGTSGAETSLASNYAPTVGTWYHVVGVADGTYMRIYVNGVERAKTAYSSNINYSTNAPFQIGVMDDNGSTIRQYWNGTIDQVQVSNTARSADVIKLSYETQKQGSTVVTIGARSQDFTNSVRLNFNTTSSGANVTGNVANIPILVRFTSANLNFTKANADGSDLLFLDPDGTRLYHEVVEWDPANQSAKVWVKVPQVNGNDSTDYITAYYGCSACISNPQAVKDSVWSGYAAVYHLAAPQSKAFDATTNGYNGTFATDQAFGSGATTPLAPYFNGTTDFITTTTPTNVATRTLEAWVKPSVSPDVATMTTIIDGDVTGQYGNGIGMDNGFFMVLLDNQFWTTNQAVSLNAWQQVAVRFNATKAVFYYNGAPKDSVTYTQGSVTNTVYTIGKSVPNSIYYTGYLNEVKVMDAYNSADFIKLSYETQKTASTLISSYTTASFQSSKVFKLNTTASGANVTGNVTNFPLLIRVTGSAICDAVQGTGTAAPPDIRFLDGDGVTWLDYQVERWNRTLDSAEVWVKVPLVEGNYAGHSITMYYQQAAGVSVPDGQCATCVFNTSDNFTGVWHLGEELAGTGTASVYKDASGSGYDGADFVSATSQQGVVGSGHDFDGTDDYVRFSAGSNFLPTTLTNLTASAWFKADAFTNGTDANRIFSIPKTDSSSAFLFAVSGLGGTNRVEYWGGVGSVWRGNTNLSTGVWTHAAVTWDGTNFRLYVNGALDAVQAGTISAGTAIQARAGIRTRDTYRPFDGHLDELRFEQIARSADWVKLEYQNQRRDAAPLFNASTADFQKTKKYVFNTTRTGANVSGNVANFPLLLRITDANGGILDQITDSTAPDIRFLDGDGKTWLNYQVERWSPGKDSGEVWVLVPQVDGNSDHDFITMYYQKASGATVSDGQCGSCVFSTDNSWKADWHLNTGVTDAGGTYNGTDVSTSDVGGIIARARSFNGTSSYIDMGNPQIHNSTAYTLLGWVKGAAAQTDKKFLSEGSTASANPLVTIGTDVAGANGKVDLYYRNDDGTTQVINHGQTSATAFDNSWHHFAVVDSDGTYVVYLDGASSRTGSYTKASKALNVFSIGAQKKAAASLFFAGSIDEVGALSTNLSANQVKLAYETQRNTGNLFWNSRAGPNNLVALTATAVAPGNISLSWNTPVSDSSNADSVAIFVKYSAFPDSVGAPSTTRVATLAKTDSAYTYPATYPGTYYFALAVRNSNGAWSPFTTASSDTANLGGSVYYKDTIYVDSAIGNNSNSCTLAQNPATPRLTVTSALTCGASANDTLVVRVMRGTYFDSAFSITTKPSIVTSFDNNSRAVMNGYGTGTLDGGARLWTLLLYGNMGIRNLDIKCLINGYAGVYITGADNIFVEGCRIYPSSSSNRNNIGIEMRGGNKQRHFANNLIYQPIYYGFLTDATNSFNFVNNVVVGDGSSGSVGFQMANNASASDMTFSNNIFYNWDYGIGTYTANIGSCASNLFFKVTTGRNITTATCTGSVTSDPLFANTSPPNRQAFKLLPGSPAIDAGSTTYGSGAQAVTRRTLTDYFGTARPSCAAPDIGLYEGSGYTPVPAAEFDTLISSSTATTITVYNSYWKVVFDKAKGGGISEFYDQAAPSTNLVTSGGVLFDAKVGSYTASANVAVTSPTFMERNKTRVVVRQYVSPSASLNLKVYYTIYASGHIYVQSEIENVSSGSAALTSLDYTLKLGSTSAAYSSSGTTKGFGYLTTSTRDAFLGVTADLDGGAATAETWASTSASGTPGSVVYSTANPSNSSRGFKRTHHFLLYVGDQSLDFQKAATVNADAYNPSVITASSGSLLLERTWQENLTGHWTLDDGAGSTARDKAVYVQNNATISGTGSRWVSGKVGGGLYLTTASVATVTTTTALDAAFGNTYMFWVKPDWSGSGSTAIVMGKGAGWSFQRSSNTIVFTMGGASVATPTLTDGVWAHIAVVVNSTGNKFADMYVNGVLVANSSSAATVASNATNVLFGNISGGNNNFQGTLDDIRIFRNEISQPEIQAVYNRGFSQKTGAYCLRADNNNRMVALINGSAAQTRVQPAFQVGNWSTGRTPKFVYLNGIRLKPNTDFVCDTTYNPLISSTLVLQLNKTLTGADQTLFIDDDDSSGYMGAAGLMKTLSITATAGDKIAIKNFADTVFGAATSGQWYTELDLNGGTAWSTDRVTDTGFGEINSWKAAAINPNVGISSAAQLVGQDDNQGRTLVTMRMDATATGMNGSGLGYLSPATITYTLADSSSTRLSLTMTNISLKGNDGTATISKRWTIYPTGRIFGSFTISAPNFNFDGPALDLTPRYDAAAPMTWRPATAITNARQGFMGGDVNFHSVVMGLLSVKNATSYYYTGATMDSTSDSSGSSPIDFEKARIYMKRSLFTYASPANAPITVNFAVDISKDFSDSATADSLIRDLQTPGVISVITGTRTTTDALDFNGDNFAEGDGAYPYLASSGIAHFKFVNSVTTFNPAFRIGSWTNGVLPEIVMLDNQVLTKGYQYNAYLNTATNEVVLQFNKTLIPGTHVIYISHKSGLAVTLRTFTATGGEGVDTLAWSTESEFENLGYHVYRRLAPGQSQIDTALGETDMTAGAGIANALAQAARTQQAAAKAAAAEKAAARLQTGAGDTSQTDSLPEMRLSAQELAALGFERITPKLIPGAKGGSSAVTQLYGYVDRSAAFGAAYEYLLEAVDFNGGHAQYGPRIARPGNPSATELYSNYPNPFNPITTLRFSLKEKLKVSLTIFDARGRLVRSLIRPDKTMLPGKYRLIWDGKNEGGFEVPSGQYFYRFTADRYVKTRKMILVK